MLRIGFALSRIPEATRQYFGTRPSGAGQGNSAPVAAFAQPST
jgi:hypothetical protein